MTCPSKKILNPQTGNCVLKDGKVGLKLIADECTKERPVFLKLVPQKKSDPSKSPLLLQDENYPLKVHHVPKIYKLADKETLYQLADKETVYPKKPVYQLAPKETFIKAQLKDDSKVYSEVIKVQLTDKIYESKKYIESKVLLLQDQKRRKIEQKIELYKDLQEIMPKRPSPKMIEKDLLKQLDDISITKPLPSAVLNVSWNSKTKINLRLPELSYIDYQNLDIKQNGFPPLIKRE